MEYQVREVIIVEGDSHLNISLLSKTKLEEEHHLER
jgi:autonomous glycyl radical cofactor GrcA